jgi:hypothetical protein
MTWKAVGSKGFVLDVDTSEKQNGCVSVNKKNFAKDIFSMGKNTCSVSRTDIFVLS